ncbi:hypothetical protein N7493_010023 [Penicillium malachiteum]|uniref:Uncharacterized protein n=1 Tax=Penicillium malachiteum TaxID=1324776 RepID=A0AAD6MS55_9EURO|nr:hypothetical protein N7493_010023 [Penicillium malachiteum]
MSQATMKLSDVLNFNIEKDHCVTCLARTKKNTQCTHPVALKSSNKAHELLQHVMTFQEREHDLIEEHIKELSDLLIHGVTKHANSEEQKRERRAEWRRMWHTRMNETRNQQFHEDTLAWESTSEELDFLEHGLQETDSVSVTQHAGIASEPLSLATEARPEPAQFQFASILETMEDSSHALAMIPPGPFHPVQEETRIVSDQSQFSPESPALSVFMTPNQQIMVETVIQYLLQFCLAFQIQFGSSIEFKLLAGVRIPLPSFRNSLYLIVPIIFLFSQVMNIFLGPILGLFLIFLGSLGAWYSVET